MTRSSTSARQALPRITKILTIEPFQLTCLWTTAEIRQIDFLPLFNDWRKDNDTQLFPLFDLDTFKQVAVSPAHTLHWPTVIVELTLASRIIQGPVALDPDELYRQSVLLQKTEPLAVGALLRQAREKAGLSQQEVATKSGTTRNYISRIENGKSDIQLETLNKIVQLGMGRQVRIDIG